MTEECEFEFVEKLSPLLTEGARWKVFYGGRGAGKCLAIGTRVIMFDGSLRAVEDVMTGEFVMGPDSKPRKVLGTTRGRAPMYKVKQTSGMEYIVNDAHILSLKKSKSSFFEDRYPEYNEITNINVEEAYRKSKRWQSHFRGYRAGLIDFEAKDILIDPWYLGAWLGDGKSNDNIIYSMDDEVLKACQKLADELDMSITIYSQPSKCVGIKLARKLGTRLRNDLRESFDAYNLFDNKHIPQIYKSNSEANRLQLLAGLLDTDGSLAENNYYEITLVDKTLALDVKQLADHLGFRTKFKERKTICVNNGVEGIAYRLVIGGDIWRIPCKIARKQIKENECNKNKDWLLSQIEIEPIGEGEYAGFSLDGDHLFLLEDGTVTHNTEGFAIALILLSRTKRLRILCGREFQNSIDESVKATLESWIIAMGLEHEFKILNRQIINIVTGSRFFFMGLRYNINKIKSLGRIDICWIEEADKTSKATLDKLAPTIRGRSIFEEDRGGPFGNGPEIWISFNPDLDDDEVYKRFVIERHKYAPEYVLIDNSTGDTVMNKDGSLVCPNPSDYANSNQYTVVKYGIVVKINYYDNPYFPPDLRTEMNVLRAASETKYLEVWEGNTKIVLDGAIYADELREVLKEGRRGRFPYNPNKPVYTFWDLGHNDKTAIWFVQRSGVEYNIIDYYEDRLKKIPFYIKILQDKSYNYGMHYLPHDGDSETVSNITPKKQLEKVWPKLVKIVDRPSRKAVGINAARSVLPLCNFDEQNTSQGWQCLQKYAYKVDEETGVFSKEPAHDTPWSHGADGFQTFALSLKTEQDSKKSNKTPQTRVINNMPTRQGWMQT